MQSPLESMYTILTLWSLLDHIFKGLAHPKMKFLSLITHPLAVPNLVQAQKGSKDIDKIVHVTTMFQP